MIGSQPNTKPQTAPEGEHPKTKTTRDETQKTKPPRQDPGISRGGFVILSFPLCVGVGVVVFIPTGGDGPQHQSDRGRNVEKTKPPRQPADPRWRPSRPGPSHGWPGLAAVSERLLNPFLPGLACLAVFTRPGVFRCGSVLFSPRVVFSGGPLLFSVGLKSP